MDAVYKLTNLSKTEGKRFYIGSKTECHLGEIDGIPTIINTKTLKPYYSSSQCEEFREDMKRGDVISAEILRKTTLKNRFIDEKEFLLEVDAANNNEYYNKTNNAFGQETFDMDSICNIYGESYKELAYRESSLSKRDKSAIDCGFDNFGIMTIYIIKEINKGVTMAQISRDIGRKKHFCRSTIAGYDLEQIKLEIENKDEYLDDLRDYVHKGASFYKACELVGITIFSGRVMLGDYEKQKSYGVAYSKGKSKEELEDIVIEHYLKNGTTRSISEEVGMNDTSARRYLLRGLRRRLDYQVDGDKIVNNVQIL